MSCDKWHIGILGASPSFEVEASEGAQLSCGVFGMSPVISVAASAGVKMLCGLVSMSPKFEIGILCKAGLERWLEVTPDEPAWLTEDNDWSYDYEVSSNLKWTIE